jgi:hypothetical protein
MGIGRYAILASALAALAGAATGQGPNGGYDGDHVVQAGEPADRPQPRWHAATPERRQAADAAVAAFNNPTLTRFASEDEFRRYLGSVLAAQRTRQGWYAASGHIQFAQAETDAQSDAIDPICPDSDPQCALTVGEQESNVVVTGSRISAARGRAASPAATNPGITNNQMRGVEEGDIVKQIDHYLLVLQDGRIFVIDTRAQGGAHDSRRLALADRTNVYRSPRENMWYDEMLVFGDRVLITGYSYRHRATELSVFRWR